MKELRLWAKEQGLELPEQEKLPVVAANKKRREILDWARDNHLIIHPGRGFDYYIDSFFMFNCCPCDDTRKNCPCPESIEECRETGYCKCRLYWRDYDIYKAKNLPV